MWFAFSVPSYFSVHLIVSSQGFILPSYTSGKQNCTFTAMDNSGAASVPPVRPMCFRPVDDD